MAIYLDNAATSYPKPETVYEAVDHFSRELGASSGRGAYRRALKADQLFYDTRVALAELFNAPDPGRIIFTSGATEAINLAIFGLLNRGDHVITTGIEHNSVWRSLKALQRADCIEVDTAEHRPDGSLVVDSIRDAVREHTRLVVVNHASNVLGTLMPVAEIGRITRELGIPLLVDAAQTAGCRPIDVQEMGVDLLAFTGHKSLLGPQGTGGLVIGPDIHLSPIRFGGTGSESAREDQPDVLPDRFEVGTLNGPGIAGLNAGARYVLDRGVERIAADERQLVTYARNLLGEVPGCELYGSVDPCGQVPVISMNFDWAPADEVAFLLDDEYGIMVRAGLHCSPTSHRIMGTLHRGALRVSLGCFNGQEDVDRLIRAFGEIHGTLGEER